MKISIAMVSTLLLAQGAMAQNYSRPTSRVVQAALQTPCECRQVRTLTGQDDVAGGQRDGSQSVCLFQPFAFNNVVSFQGGWHLTGDIVAYECSGGVAGSGRTTYGSQPSPLCRVTSSLVNVASPGRCVHQSDLNRDNAISSDERAAWVVKNTPITEGPAGYVGKASQMAIDFWNLSYSMLLTGSDLCDPAVAFVDPRRHNECLNTPVECRRLAFVDQVNPIMSSQIQSAYSGYSNSLDHCAVTGQ